MTVVQEHIVRNALFLLRLALMAAPAVYLLHVLRVLNDG